eukprot:XP_001704066.1 Hypothetical protein GL50803_37811 [Giardia lamblia ATCC 50803]
MVASVVKGADERKVRVQRADRVDVADARGRRRKQKGPLSQEAEGRYGGANRRDCRGLDHPLLQQLDRHRVVDENPAVRGAYGQQRQLLRGVNARHVRVTSSLLCMPGVENVAEQFLDRRRRLIRLSC